MLKSNYEVEILVNGHPVKEYFWNNGRVYIEGRKSNNFSIRIKNNGWKRIVAIPSVDGLSVMNGKDAKFNSGGYIINGYSSITIDGWRTSEKEIAKFYFTDPEDSYAERTDNGKNLGVIGIVIFREKEKPDFLERFKKTNIWPYNDIVEPQKWPKDKDTIRMFNMNSDVSCQNRCYALSNMKQEIGTGFGETKRDEVITVDFDREDSADAIFEIFYNTRKQLEKMGMDFSEPKYVTPVAFPGQWCEPPKR